jgi:dynein light chain roadblock-type
MDELEETLKRILSYKGVIGVLIMNNQGITIKSTLDNDLTFQYSSLFSQFTEKAKSIIKELDNTNDLTFLNIRSKKHEIMIATEKEYIFIVIKDPNILNEQKFV